MRLLCWQWDKGGLPDNQRQLAVQIGAVSSTKWATTWRRIWQQIGAKFTRGDDGLLRNKRLERVREELSTYKAVRSKGGKARTRVASRDLRGRLAPAGALAGALAGAPAGDLPPSPSTYVHSTSTCTSQVQASPIDRNVLKKVQRPDGRSPSPSNSFPTDQRTALARAPADDGNFSVLVRLTHAVMDLERDGDPTSPDIIEAVKVAAAQRGILYPPEVLHRALRCAATQRVRSRRPASATPLAAIADQLRVTLQHHTLPATARKMARARR